MSKDGDSGGDEPLQANIQYEDPGGEQLTDPGSVHAPVFLPIHEPPLMEDPNENVRLPYAV